MNEQTIERLEFDRVLDRLEACCGSAGGRLLVDDLDLEVRAAAVRARLALTSEARRFLDQRPPEWSFGDMPDVGPALERLSAGGMLEPRELHALRLMLEFAAAVHSASPSADEYPTIADIAAGLFTAPDVAARIARSVDASGAVLDSASPQLARARRRIRSLEVDIPKILNTFVNDPSQADVVQERIVTMRNGRFVVPVVAGRMREGFVLQDRSASGASAFVEPLHVVERNNNLINERINERNEVLAVLQSLTELLYEYAVELDALSADLARLDFLIACGRLSGDMRGSEPEIVEGDAILIKAGRHPLLTGDPAPVDIALGGDTRALVLSGPNAGGKTVALKMVGLFQLMAQAGLHVPADPGTALPVFPRVYAVIGDEQSIENSLSTFTSHLRDIAGILESAGRGALALIDEICSGTDPQEGTALACSIIKNLMDRGAVCMATSHHGGLKTFASVTPGARNARVLFDEQSATPRYIVEIGLPGKSHALEIAARAGVPGHIIDGARSFRDAQSRMAEEMLAELEHIKGSVAVERAQIEAKKQELQQAAQRARQKLTEAEEKQREILARAVDEAEKLIAETGERCRGILDKARAAATLPQKAEVKGDITRERRKVQRMARKTEPRASRGITVKDLNPQAPLVLRDSGDRVEYVSGPDRKGNVRVMLGGLSMTTHVRSLGVSDQPHQPAPAYKRNRDHDQYIDHARRSAKAVIDLHGMRVVEAFEVLERELLQHHLAGSAQCDICHGIGTGALMKAVHEYLGEHPLVRRFEPAPLSQGGIGVTIVFFKD